MQASDEKCVRVARSGDERVSGQSWSSASLPSDLVGRAVNRLAWVALLGAVTTLIFHILQHYLDSQNAALVQRNPLTLPNLILMIGVSAAVCVLAWSGKVPPMLMLDFGLIYEVAGALSIALFENTLPWAPDQPVRQISWVCVWITVFILVVPNTPGKTLLAALASASMGPVGFFTQMLVSDNPAPSTGIFFLLFWPNYVCAIWAFFLSRFVYRMGADVSKARDLGSYTLLEPIGQGGMGEVWRAKHRMLARTSAIKLIRPEMCGRDLRMASTTLRRFQREALATAALRSPHTVNLYDFGTTDDGSFYYVMELLDGLDLESLVKRFGPQPAARVSYFLQQACDSLAEAHSNGLTHRDIKPRNIFLCRLGFNYDFVKVLDFGLVKNDAATELTAAGLTSDGATTGTPAYMAPEMALGSSSVDARADLYALGCVGYWLLTGQLVFEVEGAMAMALAHVQTPPVPPSQRTEVQIPEALEKVILSCLEKKPEDRPQSARELSKQLAGSDAGECWTPERAERWWRTHLPAADTARTPTTGSHVMAQPA